MVEFEYQPWKYVIVHEVVKYPLEYFITKHSFGVQEGGTGRPLNWADGIVFEHTAMPPVEDVIKEQIEGRIHWNSLNYGIMKEYKKQFKGPRSVKVPILNLSNHTVFKKMAIWIKKNFEKDTK